MQPRAPRGAGGGSRPGNVLTRRRQFITAMISLFEVILKGAFTWGHGGMEERSREGWVAIWEPGWCPLRVLDRN